MNEDNLISVIEGNRIEIHYLFADNTHLMDAFIQNKCEYEFLGILKEIAYTFNTQIGIETEPLGNGGLRRWFKITNKEESKKATITIAIITAIIAGVIVTPITTSISKVTEKLIEQLFEDPEIKALEKEKLKLEVEKLRQEISKNTNSLDSNNVVRKRRSNFYEALDKYPKIEKVSFVIVNENKKEIVEEKTIFKKEFKEFVLVSDDLDPIEIENAVIEIISPVLKKGNYKWVGLYNGEPIPFQMKSKEFKSLVQTGEVQFKNGTSIDCFLVINKNIDSEGTEKTKSALVTRVNKYFENETPIETSEGKKHRREKEESKKQLSLFANKKDEELP